MYIYERVCVNGIVHLKMQHAPFNSEWCGLLVDCCAVNISCLDLHSDGTHSCMLYTYIAALKVGLNAPYKFKRVHK